MMEAFLHILSAAMLVGILVGGVFVLSIVGLLLQSIVQGFISASRDIWRD